MICIEVCARNENWAVLEEMEYFEISNSENYCEMNRFASYGSTQKLVIESDEFDDVDF